MPPTPAQQARAARITAQIAGLGDGSRRVGGPDAGRPLTQRPGVLVIGTSYSWTARLSRGQPMVGRSSSPACAD